MCKALDDLMERNLNKGIDIGMERGIEIGIKNSIHMLQNVGTTKERIAELIADSFSLTVERANFYIEEGSVN